jgi:hypothetical protein
VGKKVSKKGPESEPEVTTRPVNVRLPVDFFNRVEALAKAYSTDNSHLIRMVLGTAPGQDEGDGRREH